MRYLGRSPAIDKKLRPRGNTPVAIAKQKLYDGYSYASLSVFDYWHKQLNDIDKASTLAIAAYSNDYEAVKKELGVS